MPRLKTGQVIDDSVLRAKDGEAPTVHPEVAKKMGAIVDELQARADAKRAAELEAKRNELVRQLKSMAKDDLL